MERVCPPSVACKEMSVAGRTYRVQRDGSFHVPNAKVAKTMIKAGECFTPKTSVGGRGFPCSCGHLSAFKTCGRCGATDLVRED